MPKLRVLIGPNRFSTTIASVNDIANPTIINTPEFVGRVVVYVKDFVGVTPDGGPPIKDCSYFDGRSRKFSILIEGRFKKRDGVEPYNADEIHFGSDFDYLPESFPHGPFNAGMRIAKFVDPATFFNETPPNGRPFIMSPYAACMNTICAYPAPDALDRALLVAHHDAAHPHRAGETHAGESFVPVEEIENGKRYEKNPWRFLGLRGDPRIESFLTTHAHLLSSPPHLTSSPTPLSPLSPDAHPLPHVHHIGTKVKSHPPPTPDSFSEPPSDEDPSDTGAKVGRMWGAMPSITPSASEQNSRPGTPTRGNSILTTTGEKKKEKKSRFSLASLRTALEGVEKEPTLGAGDLVSGKEFEDSVKVEGAAEVDRLLGPWRFGKEGVDAMEDSTFVFLDPEHAHSVPQRRKHFASGDGKHRKELVYDPDVVYTTSFFTNFCDLNTFELRMGPVHLNIAKYFSDMPIRYTLRSTRMGPRPDGKPGPEEEECFVTIAFDLVPDDFVA
ncbi:hypothetical protein P7C70_g7119, partial [Phenoliferia sp. Uapishka_3]